MLKAHPGLPRRRHNAGDRRRHQPQPLGLPRQPRGRARRLRQRRDGPDPHAPPLPARLGRQVHGRPDVVPRARDVAPAQQHPRGRRQQGRGGVDVREGNGLGPERGPGLRGRIQPVQRRGHDAQRPRPLVRRRLRADVQLGEQHLRGREVAELPREGAGVREAGSGSVELLRDREEAVCRRQVDLCKLSLTHSIGERRS